DDVAQRGSRQIDHLHLVVEYVVLRALEALLIALDLEVDLRVDPRIELVARDDFLALGVHHHLGDVDEEQAFGDRGDPVEPRLRDAPVLTEALDQAAAGRAYHANARERIDEDDRNGGKHDPGSGRHGDLRVHAARHCPERAAGYPTPFRFTLAR